MHFLVFFGNRSTLEDSRRELGVDEIISVYICDDVASLRLVIRTVLELDGDVRVVGEAGDGLTALQDVERLRPDVVVLDLSLPERDGLEVLEALATLSPQTRIIVFSGYAAEQLEATALSLGAHRYVEKGTAITVVADAVREAAKEAA